MLKAVQAIVLAAGKSTRFNTQKSKLLEKICGQEMIVYVTKTLQAINLPITMVVGHQKEAIISAVNAAHTTDSGTESPITYVTQEQQYGTGHALTATESVWREKYILVMNGDIPLIATSTIEKLYKTHTDSQATITFVTTHITGTDDTSYGRVIKENGIVRIVEAAELKTESDICCVNAGIYLINLSFLQNYSHRLSQNNAKKEFYITDLIALASDNKLGVATVDEAFDTIRGVNTLHELWAVQQIKKSELIKKWMKKGVFFELPQNSSIDVDVTIGKGSCIGAGVHLLSGTKIGANCTIHPYSLLERAMIDDNSIVYSHSIISNSHIGSNSTVGPFAHIRYHSTIGSKCSIGNFVEIKHCTIGHDTKAKHLSYLGDAHIGAHVNIGAGAITCNYDGIQKNITTIHDHAYIGSNNCLIAPVEIGDHAFTAAGSVITDNVPAQALAIARERQINKEGYAKRLRERKKEHTTQSFAEEKNKRSFIAAMRTNNDDSTSEEL